MTGITQQSFFEAAGYTCIVPTLRHHSTTSGEPHEELGTTGLFEYFSDLEKEIKQLPQKPVVIGHSLGGLLAQMLAARGLCRAAILWMPAAPAGCFQYRPSVVVSFLYILLRGAFWKKPQKLDFFSASFALFNRVAPGKRRKIYQNFNFDSGRVVQQVGLWWIDRLKAVAVDESKVRCPLLVVAGGRDRITPASTIRKIARKYKHVSDYVECPERGHWIYHEENPEELSQMAIDWLEKQIFLPRN